MSVPIISNSQEGLCRKCEAPLGRDSNREFCSRCLLEQAAAQVVFREPEGLVDQEGDTISAESERLTGDAAADRQNSRRRIASFELLEEVGRGGMGVVYRARHLSLGRQTAVKLLRFGPMAGEDYVKRLRIEAMAAGCLRHPNIVGIHEVGIYEDQHFLAMDYVEGPNLGKLADHRPFPSQRAATIVQQIARAVEYAHQHGILHRDLKPSNILIDEFDQPHITDFGLAKRIRVSSSDTPGEMEGKEGGFQGAVDAWTDEFDSMTVTGQVLGSPNYMPPEQASASKSKIGRPSDVYSMGAILYQLLTGRPPFVGETLASTLHQVLEAEAASPRLLNPFVPVDLETICLKCLQKEPERRYATACELAEELSRFLNGKPIQARPIGTVNRWWRWCRRNPFLAGFAAATVLLLLTVAIGSPLAALRIERSRVLATDQKTEAQRQLYASNMALIQQAWEQGNFLTLRQLLDETRDNEERRFEWDFWSQQLRWAMQALPGHSGSVLSAVPSPDGRWIASGGSDRRIKIWDATTGREKVTLQGHTSWVTSIDWFPDSRRLVSGSLDHQIRIWDSIQGKELTMFESGRGRVRSVVVAIDGKTVFSGNQDGTITVWSIDEGVELKTLDGHTEGVISLAVSPDGRFLASGGADRITRIWNAERGVSIRVLDESLDSVQSVDFSPDGRRIVTASGYGFAKIWDVSTGEALHTLAGHSGNIDGVTFSPNGAWVATAGEDRTTRIWDAESGREVKTLNAPMEEVSSVCFSADGSGLVIGANDGLVWLWRVSANPQEIRFRTEESSLGPIVVAPDGRLVMPRGNAQDAIWKAVHGCYLLQNGQTEGLQSFAISPDGRYLAAGMPSHDVKVWSLLTGQLLSTRTVLPSSPMAIAFSPDGRRVAVGCFSGLVNVWDAATGREVQSLLGHLDEVESLVFSGDGRRILSGSRDNSAILWNTVTGERLLSFKIDSGVVTSVGFSPDDQEILTTGSDQSTRIWSTVDGSERLTIRGHMDSVLCAAFSPDGARIVTSSFDRTIRLWDSVNGKLLLTLQTVSGAFDSVGFSSDGLRIVAIQGNGKMTQWALNSPTEEARWFSEEKDVLERVAFERRSQQDWIEARHAARLVDPGVIRQWLLLGPIRMANELLDEGVVDEEFLNQEASLRPRPGDSVLDRAVDLTWTPLEVSDGIIDVNALIGQKVEYSVAYAVSYLISETRQSGLRLLVGSDDQAKVYLNGKEVYQSRFNRAFIADEDLVEGIDLRAGNNVLVFKIINGSAGWQGSIRLTDSQGRPVQGVRMALNP